MQSGHKTSLKRLLKDRVDFEVPLGRYTSLRVGGRAWAVARPADVHEVRALLGFLADTGMAAFPLGEGTNLLVSDSGFDGVVILLKDGFTSAHFEREPSGTVVCVAGAGAHLSMVQRFLLQHGFGGFEFAAGIPGSIGGSVRMNAGTAAGEMKDVVLWIEWVTRDEGCLRFYGNELSFSYRNLDLPEGAVVVRAALKVEARDPDCIRREIRGLMKKRLQTQPIGKRSAGSVFRNPPGFAAGRLIEQAGLKGTREGAAVVSEKHANFILNEGSATATDIFRLIQRIRRDVHDQLGVRLIPEIVFLGSFGANGKAASETALSYEKIS
ncbi:MAG: UDP-N-acetylmuramate dehydrogenase [Deltaproteobacteria bacterium]|nr:UDP-N-acetylmuramate dehydrogenase [Deltaproteobacteria bacterium]